MKVIELYSYLDKLIPRELSCDWDNDGLMCCPNPQKEIKRVLVALDITTDAIKKAKELDCQVILSHHPLIFRPVKNVTPFSNVTYKVIELIKNDIAAMSFHTRLDALTGGVNDVLVKKLNILDAVPFGKEGEEMGRIGNLPFPVSLEDFAKKVKEILGAPAVLYADAGLEVSRVALLGGEGGSFISDARSAGADTFISGRLGYHPMTDGPEGGMNLVEAGHFYTEHPVCDFLIKTVNQADSEIECIKYFSNRIKTV